MRKLILVICVAACACAGPHSASVSPVRAIAPIRQASAGDQVTVEFSDSSRPGSLEVRLMQGGIRVTGTNSKSVIIRKSPDSFSSPPDRTIDGLRRIDTAAGGLRIEEQDNVMVVRSGNLNRPVDVEIQVPAKTNLKLVTQNGGEIEVSGVEGELDIRNNNGGITLNNVSGSVVAYSQNRSVIASLRQVTPGKPMSFRSMNGNVDVTLPSSIKANATMRSQNGEILSDFDMQIRPSPPDVQDLRSQGGRYRLRVDRSVYAAINGGGPDLTLSTNNGNVYVRKSR